MAREPDRTTTDPHAEAKRRLKDALPEVDLDKLGEKLAAVGGKHNLEEKWDSIARELQYFIDLTKAT